jgi:energy-coupling factor transport system ATP-binding protein
LDEPTSQLDPKSAEDVLNALVRLNNDLGLTVILAEHRLERVLPFADQLLFLPGTGKAPLLGDPRQVLLAMDQVPPLVRLAKQLHWSPLPLTIKEGLRFSRALTLPTTTAPPRPVTPSLDNALVAAQDIEVRYGRTPVLQGLDFALHSGEIVAVMGRNGSGKSTLLRSLVGLVRPQRGQVTVMGRDSAKLDVATICKEVGYLPQDPNTLLFANTVMDEVWATLRNHGYNPADDPAKLPVEPTVLLEQLGIAPLARSYPRDLSVGERQRVALAAILVVKPKALLLDEPTRGLDYGAKAQLADLLLGWRAAGMGVALVTHDVELAAALADRVVLISQGEIIAQGAPAEVLGTSPLFAPQVARLFPNTGWLTPDDVKI